MTEAIFVVLVIVGVTSTILALAALIADYLFPERPRPARIRHQSQATYKKVP
jgi:hypothetical protein